MTRMNLSILTIALASTMALAACSDPAETSDSASTALVIATHTEQVVAGSYDAGDMIVTFRCESPRAYVGVAAVSVNGKTLTMTVDAYRGDIDFDAADASLGADEVAALVSFSLELETYLGRVEDTDAMHESVLFRTAEYLAQAPASVALRASHHQVTGLDRAATWSTDNDGKTCIQRNTTRTAKYDGDQGTRSEDWVVGSNGGQQWNGNFDCMGRCGSACGGGDWTLDCLEHDACSRHYYSSTGAFDHNCGDEYSNASDDYMNFWKRCGG